MADLGGFDANEVEPNGDLPPLPAGKYVAVVTESEMKPTKSGTGEYLQLQFQIIEGPYQNRLVWVRLNLNNPNDEVLVDLLRNDKQPEQRQLALIDMQGRTATHNPSAAGDASQWWGTVSGRNFSCQGNTLAGREVVTEMAKAFEVTQGSLSDKLMAALVAGDAAGGDHRGRLAAGIRIVKKGTPGYSFELYVDHSDDAVNELWQKYLAISRAAPGK